MVEFTLAIEQPLDFVGESAGGGFASLPLLPPFALNGIVSDQSPTGSAAASSASTGRRWILALVTMTTEATIIALPIMM